jgi:hypothetical protein
MNSACLIADRDDRFEGLPLMVEYIDGRKWRVARSISYRVSRGRFTGRLCRVLGGFEFDFASIPRFLWRVFPPAGLTGNPYGIAALFHDRVYAEHYIDFSLCDRAEADALFYEIMIYVGCRPSSAWLMYRAVRMFGWFSWKRDVKPRPPTQRAVFA